MRRKRLQTNDPHIQALARIVGGENSILYKKKI